jgi:hypothetical protein
MKQRITYVVNDPDSFTPELLEVKKDGSKDSFVVNGLLDVASDFIDTFF